MVRRNHHLVVLNICLESGGPFRRNLANAVAESVGKLIAIFVVSLLCESHVGLRLPHSIQIDHTIVQPYPVSRHANDALDQIHSLFGGIRSKEDGGVSAVDPTIWQQPAQFSPCPTV